MFEIDESTFEGEFENGLRKGYGIFKYSNGK